MLDFDEKPTVIGYIDGYNLSYALKAKGWRDFYWIDPFRLIQALVPEHELIGVNYFTSLRNTPIEARDRQLTYLDVLDQVSRTKVIRGGFKKKHRRCAECRERYECPACSRQVSEYEEKKTDCAIVAEMVADSFTLAPNRVVLVSADTDHVPAILKIRKHHPGCEIHVWFPPGRSANELSRIRDGGKTIKMGHLEWASLPYLVQVAPGVEKECPERWCRSSGVAAS